MLVGLASVPALAACSDKDEGAADKACSAPPAAVASPSDVPGDFPKPTESDRVVIASNPTSLLGPDRPGEVANKVPGPVDDVEAVQVGVGPDGAPTSVVVDQTLTVTGVGDFSFKEPGPAIDVAAPPGAGS